MSKKNAKSKHALEPSRVFLRKKTGERIVAFETSDGPITSVPFSAAKRVDLLGSTEFVFSIAGSIQNEEVVVNPEFLPNFDDVPEKTVEKLNQIAIAARGIASQANRALTRNQPQSGRRGGRKPNPSTALLVQKRAEGMLWREALRVLIASYGTGKVPARPNLLKKIETAKSYERAQKRKRLKSTQSTQQL